MTTTEEAIASIRRMEGALVEIQNMRGPLRKAEVKRIATDALRHVVSPAQLIEMIRDPKQTDAVHRGFRMGESGWRFLRHRVGLCRVCVSPCYYCEAETGVDIGPVADVESAR